MKNCQGYVARLDEESWGKDPILTEPELFEKLSALPEERIRL